MSARKLHAVQAVPDVAGQLPPHDLEAEAATISSLLLKPAVVPAVLAIAKPEDFFAEQNRVVMRAIVHLDGVGRPIDTTTVCSHLRDVGALGAAGGVAYLAQLVDATPSVANVKIHAQIVAGKARRRRVIAAMQAASARSYVGTDDEADATVQQLQAQLTAEEATAHVDTMASLEVALGEAAADAHRAHERAADGQAAGLSTGIAPLDAATGGLHLTDLLFIGAPKGGGKTSLAAELAIHTTTQGEWSEGGQASAGAHDVWMPYGAAIFTMEMPRAQYAGRIACAHAGIDSHALRNGTATAGEFSAFYGACDELRRKPIVIDDGVAITPSMVDQRIRRARAELAAKGAKLRVVVVDYLQLMDPDVARGERDTEESKINEIGRALRKLSQRHTDITLVVLSQLNEKGQLRGSRALEMHAVCVWTVHIDWADSMRGAKAARVNISKQRFGPACDVPLWFHPMFTRFSEAA